MWSIEIDGERYDEKILFQIIKCAEKTSAISMEDWLEKLETKIGIQFGNQYSFHFVIGKTLHSMYYGSGYRMRELDEAGRSGPENIEAWQFPAFSPNDFWIIEPSAFDQKVIEAIMKQYDFNPANFFRDNVDLVKNFRTADNFDEALI